MPFSEHLAGGVRDILFHRRDIVEKRMFGGVVFLLHGNILVGVWSDLLIVRVGPDQYAPALQEPYVREFDVTGRPMKGWVMVEPEGLLEDDQIRAWIERALPFVERLPPK